MEALQEWSSRLETAYSAGLIDMGLECVGEVKKCMGLQPQCPVVVVAGTNGRGSVYAYLLQIYTQTGFKVGTLTSPYLLRYNERVTVNTRPIEDAAIVALSEHIEAACTGTSLTYSEFSTLAAVDTFIREKVDVMVLEVGSGGWLDTVNVFDADCAVVTSVDLDHQAFLGDIVEQVAFGKTDAFRSGKPTIHEQTPPPESLRRHAGEIGVELLLTKRDFDFSTLENMQWPYRYRPQNLDGRTHNRNALPFPALRGVYQLSNAVYMLTVLECLGDRSPTDIAAIKCGLLLVENPGCFQVLPGRSPTALDVGHNPYATRALHRSLINLMFAERRTVVFSILADKDIDGMLDIVKDQFDEWHIAPLDVPCGIMAGALVRRLSEHGIENIKVFENIEKAYRAILEKAGENDRIVALGSSYTVAAVMAALS